MDLHEKIQQHKAQSVLADKIQESKGGQKPSIGSYFKEPLISTLNLGQSIGKYTNPLEYIWPQESIDWRKEVGGVPEEQRTTGHKAAALVPEIAASLLAPEARIPEAGGFLAKQAIPFAKNVLTQGGVAAAFNPENALESGSTAAGVSSPFFAASQMIASQNPTVKLAGRLLQSLLGGYAGKQAADIAGGGTVGEIIGGGVGTLLASKGRETGALKSAAREIKEGVKGTEYKTLLDYGKDLGFKYLTPVEASGTPSLGRQQGTIARTEEGGKILYKQGADRIATEKQAFDNILNTIYNPEYSKTYKNKLYESAHQTKVPTENVTNFAKDPVIAQAIKDLEGNAAFQKKLEGVPTDSLKYWDFVKKAIYDREKGLKRGTEERAVLAETRNELVSELDKLSPQYKQARMISELENTKKSLIKAFDKTEIKGSNIYNYLKSDTKFEDLMHSLRNIPEAQEKLKKLRAVTKNLVNPITPKTAVGYGTTGMYESRNTAKEMAQEISDKLTRYFKGGTTGEKIAELLTNPQWETEVDNILKLTRGEKVFSEGSKLTGKTLGQALATRNREDRK